MRTSMVFFKHFKNNVSSVLKRQILCLYSISVVAVAQLVEPRIVIPMVVGSNPISHPKDLPR